MPRAKRGRPLSRCAQRRRCVGRSMILGHLQISGRVVGTMGSAERQPCGFQKAARTLSSHAHAGVSVCHFLTRVDLDRRAIGATPAPSFHRCSLRRVHKPDTNVNRYDFRLRINKIVFPCVADPDLKSRIDFFPQPELSLDRHQPG